MEYIVLAILSFVGVSFISFILSFIPLGLWISALSSGVNIGLFSLIGMRLRRVKPSKIIEPLIKAHKSGIEVSLGLLEAHLLSGGNVDGVVNALIAAQRAGLDLTFEKATAIDLAGRDVFQAVQTSVTPVIINTTWISAVAKDGIEIKVVAKVTVKSNLDRLVGGAGSETIIARVGEGIVTTVGSSIDHKAVLENPNMISDKVLESGLDSGTAFEILSIDIADIDIGKNVGADLQIQQAEADKKIAQADAEKRRANAIATEQENKAKVEEMKAKVVEAEARIPEAIAKALVDGNIGVMDYYRMNNIQADSNMKNGIAGTGIPGVTGEDKKSSDNIIN